MWSILVQHELIIYDLGRNIAVVTLAFPVSERFAADANGCVSQNKLSLYLSCDVIAEVAN